MSASCSNDEFKCRSELETNRLTGCIPKEFVCDGQVDCDDRSDERKCDKLQCREKDDLQCLGEAGMKMCISSKWKCDGQIDCADGADEKNCTKKQCGRSEFNCGNSLCIYANWRCDGEDDCRNGADERNCGIPGITCNPQTMFNCKSGSGCIPLERKCDGESDCRDRSDEEGCPATNNACKLNTDFACLSGNTCIDKQWMCDGQIDCPDGSDEEHCGVVSNCGVGEKLCGKGSKCIASSLWCNGIIECPAGDDEFDCPRKHIVEKCCSGRCDQICEITDDSYKCSCHRGYQLVRRPGETVASRCRAIGEDPLILLSNRGTISQFNMATNTHVPLIQAAGSVVAMDFHLDNQTHPHLVRYSDAEDNYVQDWSFYGEISSSPEQISVMDLTTLKRRVLFADAAAKPTSIVGLIFWSDWGRPARIERAGMDGENRRVLEITEITDEITGKNTKAIFSSDYDGNDIRVVLQSHSLLHHPLSLCVFEDRLFYTDREHYGVTSINKFTGSDETVLMSTVSTPMAVRIYHRAAQPMYSNKCTNNDCPSNTTCLPRGSDSSHLSQRPFSCKPEDKESDQLKGEVKKSEIRKVDLCNERMNLELFLVPRVTNSKKKFLKNTQVVSPEVPNRLISLNGHFRASQRIRKAFSSKEYFGKFMERLKLTKLFNSKRIRDIFKEITGDEKKIPRVSELHRDFVVTMVDKASGNYAITCKKLYLQFMEKELNTQSNDGKTYEIKDQLDPVSIKLNHEKFTRSFGIAVQTEGNLPKIYGIPKMHKNPIKFRFITGAHDSTLKPLSIELQKILRFLHGHFRRYCYSITGHDKINRFFSIQNTFRVVQQLNTVQNKRSEIFCADFSSLFTNLPHSVVKEKLYYLIDLMFKNAGSEYIVVQGTNVRYDRNNSSTSGRSYHKNDLKGIIEFILRNSFAYYGGNLYQQQKGIPRGNNASPQIADLTLAGIAGDLAPSARGRKKSSPWRAFFKLIPGDTDHMECKICPAQIKCDTGTTGLKAHVKSCNPSGYAKVDAGDRHASISNQLLISWAVKTSLPLNKLAHPSFNDFVQFLDPLYEPPSRKELGGSLLDRLYNKSKEEVKQAVKGQNVSVVIDHYSDLRSGIGMMGCTAHFIDDSFRRIPTMRKGRYNQMKMTLMLIAMTIMVAKYLVTTRKCQRKTIYIDDRFHISYKKDEFVRITTDMYHHSLTLEQTNTDPKESAFLDMSIKVTITGAVQTSLYNKTDDYSFSVVRYPHYESNIPISMGLNTLHGEIIRIFRNCSLFEHFLERTRQLARYFLQVQYPKEILCSRLYSTLNKTPAISLKYAVCNNDICMHIIEKL
ncbi:hypothetical protein PRIPAC_89034 [Pristionchus pacificus]|uniref:Lipoprotein receptor n=1 Tax=Pristionchus pacificus TaxID=54126 RepID=A0A2A6B8U6_PRIPA|nr:hypothetical protein PRIPAC_89034 [Pristionchus pacificus]|eukprot:PDM62295.1 lipoprotein receptor [Pristionchus pacificus]